MHCVFFDTAHSCVGLKFGLLLLYFISLGVPRHMYAQPPICQVRNYDITYILKFVLNDCLLKNSKLYWLFNLEVLTKINGFLLIADVSVISKKVNTS